MELVTADQVPEHFNRMLEQRKPGERARLLSMSTNFHMPNPMLKVFEEHAEPEDVLAISLFGHRYGETPRLSLGQAIATLGLMPIAAGDSWRIHHQMWRRAYTSRFRGDYVVTNRAFQHVPHVGGLLGQSHIKGYLVGDNVLSLGGVNATFRSTTYTDAMVAFRSPDFSAFADEFIERRGDFRKESKSGRFIEHDDHNLIIIDHGHAGASPILEAHLADARRRPSVVKESSNYVPSAVWQNTLADLKSDGAEVWLHANRWTDYWPSFEHSAANIIPHMISTWKARKAGLEMQRKPTQDYNHLKFCEMEFADGQRVAYLRSATLSWGAIGAGTCEVALRTTDPDLIDQIATYRDSRLLQPET